VSALRAQGRGDLYSRTFKNVRRGANISLFCVSETISHLQSKYIALGFAEHIARDEVAPDYEYNAFK
jgi:hypothetical protein